MIETVRFLSGTVGLFSVMKSKSHLASTTPATFFLTIVQEIDQYGIILYAKRSMASRQGDS